MRRFSLALPLAALCALAAANAAEPLDAADEAFRAAGYRQAWAGPVGQEQRWTNPASGHAGAIRAVRERIDPATRQPCREILETVIAGGPPASGYAAGCRDTEGAWRIVQTGTVETAPHSAAGPAPADVTPYVAPADIAAAGSGSGALSGLPAPVRILVPWHGAAGAPPPAPR